MILGHGGFCKKELEDENVVVYSYSSYNLNEEQFKYSDRIYDGTIMIEQGQIQIENSKNTWKMLLGFDYIAISLCRIIFREYQLNGILPDNCGCNV